MIKVNKKFILLLGIALLYALLEGGSLPFIIFYGLISILILNYIHISILKYFMSAEVAIKDNVKEAGDSLNYLTIVKNDSMIPIPYVAVENQICDGCSGNYKQASNMAFDENIWIESDVKFYQRGTYNLGCININIMDVLRIFRYGKTEDCSAYVKVYPKIYSIQKAALGGRDNFQKAIDPLGLSENIFSIKDIRKYREGDSLRKIHWKVSARYNELYVKTSETISGGELSVFMDMGKNNYKLDSKGVIEESMVDLCMSITHDMLSNGIKISVFLNTLHSLKFNIASREDFDSMMEFVLNQKSDGVMSFEQFIYDNSHKLQKTSPVAVIVGEVGATLASSIIDIKASGFDINVFYCAKGKNIIDNVSLLKRSGIRCFSFYDMVDVDMGVEIIGEDAQDSLKES